MLPASVVELHNGGQAGSDHGQSPHLPTRFQRTGRRGVTIKATLHGRPWNLLARSAGTNCLRLTSLDANRDELSQTCLATPPATMSLPPTSPHAREQHGPA